MQTELRSCLVVPLQAALVPIDGLAQVPLLCALDGDGEDEGEDDDKDTINEDDRGNDDVYGEKNWKVDHNVLCRNTDLVVFNAFFQLVSTV